MRRVLSLLLLFASVGFSNNTSEVFKLVKGGRYDEAIELIQKTLESDTKVDRGLFHYWMGFCYSHTDREEEALEQARLAKGYDLSYLGGYISSLDTAEKWDDIIKETEKLVKNLYVRHPFILGALFTAYWKKGQFTKAERIIQFLDECNYSDVEGKNGKVYVMAYYHGFKGDTDEALSLLEKLKGTRLYESAKKSPKFSNVFKSTKP